jgi:hypothetical protein
MLDDCDIVPELNGVTYKDLPRALEIKLKRSYVRAEILRKESDPRLRYYMFKRLNTGGEILSAQEVRNATIRLLSNDFNQFIVGLANNEDFAYCTEIISEQARLKRFNEELVLRFFAFKNASAVYRHDVTDFLTDYMEDISDPSTPINFDYKTEAAVFEKTFRVLRMISESLAIDTRIFGTAKPGSSTPRGQFSVYHYEGLTLGLQKVLDRIDVENRAQISALSGVVSSGKFDPEFLKHGGAGKNQRNALLARVAYFARGFEEVLN